MFKYLKAIILLIALLMLSSCSLTSTPGLPGTEITATEAVISHISTVSPSPIPPTPTNTSLTSTATNTPYPPTATYTPVPTSLNASGPYVFFFGHGGIWITNPDGSFPTRLVDMDIYHGDLDWRRNISPTGDRMALVVSSDEWLDLVIVKIPSGESETITHLISRPSPENYDPISPNSFATYAIRDYDSVAWQPDDGRLLAFIGAMNGPTADLYLYNTQTKEITQLTDGPSQAVLPVWSPDGQYVLHYGVRWVPPFGGAIGPANQLDGLWAVRVSDGEVITLPKPGGSVPHFVGWQDDSHYITYDPGECYSEDLRSIDIVNGEATPIMDISFWYYIAQSPENGAFLFSSKLECASSMGEGVFILLPDQTTPTKLLEKRAWGIEWMPESQIFFAYPEVLISSDGRTLYDTPIYAASFSPAVSKEGYHAWKVYENQLASVMVSVSGSEWQTIMDGSIDELIWDPLEGNTLLITMADGS